MDALIIAAGFGTRISPISDSKPLTPIAGIPLLELGAGPAAPARAPRGVVVTGHEAARIEAALPAIAQRAGVPVLPTRVDDWSKPNGFSVMAGAAAIAAMGGGDFLLTMADHIFAAPLIAGLAAQGGADRGVTLAIDTRITSPLIDPDDATWVQRGEQWRIVAIGKTIADYDCVDCGAFLATQELPSAIAAAIAEGKSGSLSDGMQWLADRGRAQTWDVGTDDDAAWWMDVDDPRAHALAEAEAPVRLADLYR